ncbi:hypothetical protein IE53DRAFT_409074 [Violaceomyces palustris]|uniref:Uncharacterized protein n=1 Tax=Violaceomyces palustris TaxID=1673888 RepID=A0ACD0P496_9BASI|nr:hypothetical protein IE53DRAFT_409074 [Violaceomyces palustris]
MSTIGHPDPIPQPPTLPNADISTDPKRDRASSSIQARGALMRNTAALLIDGAQHATLNLLGHALTLSCILPALALSVSPDWIKLSGPAGHLTQVTWDAHDWLEEMEFHRLADFLLGVGSNNVLTNQRVSHVALPSEGEVILGTATMTLENSVEREEHASSKGLELLLQDSDDDESVETLPPYED